ncbi:MAG: NAD(P)/FAD-dependent oxidoreductase [Spirosomataceae bacterium]
MLDYLIVGQGLAGSITSHKLRKLGKKIKVISNSSWPSSSQVAGGMFNPVTGKHLAKTWLADVIFPYLLTYYAEVEQELSARFLHQVPIFRPFANEKQRTQFLKIMEENPVLASYLTVIETPEEYSKQLKNKMGGLLTRQSGWIDVPCFLQAWKADLEANDALIDETFAYSDLKMTKEGVRYKTWEAKRIIFCEGFFAKDNPYFSWLPFNPVKGETLVAEVQGFPDDKMVNQGKWMIPLGNHLFRLGATYVWHELDWEPTADGRVYLSTNIERFLAADFQIVQQQAGVRPATKDRRPIIGKHPEYENMYIVNGLGTKGVSLGPWCIQEFIDYLENGKELNSEITIERHYSLY